MVRDARRGPHHSSIRTPRALRGDQHPAGAEPRLPSKAATIGDQHLRVRVSKVIQGIGGPGGGSQGLDGGLQEIMDINARVESDLGVFMKRTRERENKEDEFLKRLKAMKEL